MNDTTDHSSMMKHNCWYRRLNHVLRTTLAPVLVCAAALPFPAHASFLSGETLDTAANVISWFALFIVPVVLVTVFWLVHILPEKIAEERRHPQLAAIKVLCLLSLFFGGLLWPLAWLWAYTKPVFHKFAYGTDVSDHPEHGEALTPLHDAGIEHHHQSARTAASEAAEESNSPADVEALKRRIQSLEMALAVAGGATHSTNDKTTGHAGE
jgi:CBS domain containing-hemolysin-like protein